MADGLDALWQLDNQRMVDRPAREARIRAIRNDIYNRHGDVLADGSGGQLDPAGAADAIEAYYGKLETQPGWHNAKELKDTNDRLGKGWMDPSAKWTQSPERYDYMQRFGRDVDFLRALAEDTKARGPSSPTSDDIQEKALHYWDKSNGARSTDNWTPNYQRFAGLGNQFSTGVTDRAVPFAAFIQSMDLMPNMLKELLGGASTDQASERAHALNQFQQRYRLGKNPVLDLPSPDRKGRSEEQAIDDHVSWLERAGELTHQRGALEPPSGQTIVNHRAGGKTSAFVGDVVDTAASAFDPSLIASMGTSIPGRAVARSLLRPSPMRSFGRRTAGDWARAAAGQSVSEAVPEAVFAGAVGAASGEDRTWKDYFTAPAAEGKVPSELRDAAARQMLSHDQMSVPDVRDAQPVFNLFEHFSNMPKPYRPTPMPVSTWR